MLTDAELLQAYDEQIRLWIPDPPPAGRTLTRIGPVLRVTGMGPNGFISTARDLGVEGAELDALIAEHQAFYAARGESVEWKTRGHDLPASLPSRLAAAGFVPQERETLVLGEAAVVAGPTVLPAGVSLRRVHERVDLERLAAAQTEIWGGDMSWLVDDLAVRSSSDEAAVFIVEAGDEVVSSAWLTIRPGLDFAGLWGGSTAPQWRGRGIYRALVAHRATLAVERGVPLLQVDASDESLPILTRLGLRPVGTTTPYVWSPPAVAEA